MKYLWIFIAVVACGAVITGCSSRDYLDLNKINSALRANDPSELNKEERVAYDQKLVAREHNKRIYQQQQRQFAEQNRLRKNAQQAAAKAAQERAQEAKTAALLAAKQDWSRGLREHYRSRGFEPAAALVSARQRALDMQEEQGESFDVQSYLNSLVASERNLTHKVFSVQGRELTQEWIDINAAKISKQIANTTAIYSRYLQQQALARTQNSSPINLSPSNGYIQLLRELGSPGTVQGTQLDSRTQSCEPLTYIAAPNCRFDCVNGTWQQACGVIR